jgi:hypothetical protein
MPRRQTMTKDDLTHIFRFQTTADIDYTPKDTVEYLLVERGSRTTGTHDAYDLSSLIVLLENFIFDGYKDRTPVFIKPESEL